jgi:hypothetical protein
MDGWGQGPAQENIVCTNYGTQSFVGQNRFSKQCTWCRTAYEKLIGNTHGYTQDCWIQLPQGNRIIMDSVFIFAFFTDEIMVTGGPESFKACRE